MRMKARRATTLSVDGRGSRQPSPSGHDPKIESSSYRIVLASFYASWLTRLVFHIAQSQIQIGVIG
ncbi:hypothetical protein D3C87_1939360 [compost metagenome]